MKLEELQNQGDSHHRTVSMVPGLCSAGPAALAGMLRAGSPQLGCGTAGPWSLNSYDNKANPTSKGREMDWPCCWGLLYCLIS